MTPLLVAAAAAVAMEPIAAWTHRIVMHGSGWAWHESHHAVSPRRLERNDRYPAVFALAAIGLLLVGDAVAPPLVWVGAGVSLYGVCYVVVHDVCIHGRLGRRIVRGRYLRWVAAAHAVHHESASAPYGFLLPLRAQRNMSRLASRSTGAMVAESSGIHE